jgi:integrase
MPKKPVEIMPKRSIIGRHKQLLLEPNIRSWWESKSIRSQLSADQYLRFLGHLAERLKVSLPQVVEMAQKDPDRLRDLLVKDATKLKSEGKLDSYISKYSEGLKSYLKFRHITFDGYPSLSPIRGESLRNERIPTPEELGKVLDLLSTRGRVVALLMAHSGLRPGVIGSYGADNGLTLADLPELKLSTLSFPEAPFVIRVPGTLSKTRVSYVTFGSSQLESALLAYLGERKRSGEKLSPQSPVILALPTRGAATLLRQGDKFAKGFITTKGVVCEIRDALQASLPEGVTWRPYVLRSYCSTRLLMAEGAGKMTRDLREALLGHDLGVSGRYTLGKMWGPDILKEARRSYKRAESYLNTVQVSAGEDVIAEMRRGILMGFGYTPEELKPMDLGELDDEEFRNLVAKKKAELIKSATPPASTSAPARRVQKVVEESEIDPYLEKGWTVATTLGGGKRVVLDPPLE